MMTIEIPSGRIRLDGKLVISLHYKPYVWFDGDKVYLTEEQKRIAKEMRKAFEPMIEKKRKKLSDFL